MQQCGGEGRSRATGECLGEEEEEEEAVGDRRDRLSHAPAHLSRCPTRHKR